MNSDCILIPISNASKPPSYNCQLREVHLSNRLHVESRSEVSACMELMLIAHAYILTLTTSSIYNIHLNLLSLPPLSSSHSLQFSEQSVVKLLP